MARTIGDIDIHRWPFSNMIGAGSRSAINALLGAASREENIPSATNGTRIGQFTRTNAMPGFSNR